MACSHVAVILQDNVGLRSVEEAGPPPILRRLARVAARTVEALEQALAPALDSITAQDAAAFFQHCGYVCPN